MNKHKKAYDIIKGKSQAVLKSLEENSIDLTVTSPPYDLLRTYENTLSDSDSVLDIIKELYRVTKVGGTVVWVVGDQTVKGSETGTSFKQCLHAMQCGFNLHDTMIYNRVAMPNNAKSNYKPLTFLPKRV